MRVAIFGLVLLPGVLALAACNGDGEKGTPTATPTAAATATASPSPAPAAVEPSCEFPSDITSYRFVMTMKMNLPSLEEIPETDEPLGEFLGALGTLFQDLRMEGAFVAPDRHSLVISAGGEIFAEFLQIGEASWSRPAGMDWAQEEAEGEAVVPLSPQDFCEAGAEDLASAVGLPEPQRETVNGVGTLHYRLDRAELEFLGLLFGELGNGEPPETFAVDLWLAEDGNWPVRMSFQASGQDSEGNPIDMEISVEFRDINDPGIEIEAPI